MALSMLPTSEPEEMEEMNSAEGSDLVPSVDQFILGAQSKRRCRLHTPAASKSATVWQAWWPRCKVRANRSQSE